MTLLIDDSTHIIERADCNEIHALNVHYIIFCFEHSVQSREHDSDEHLLQC